MAWVYLLDVECGAKRETAENIAAHYKGHKLTLTDGLITNCSPEVTQWEDSYWRAWIWIDGVSMGHATVKDRPELTDKKHTSEIGHLLYERLRSAPDFRFAIVGWEVDAWQNVDELDEWNMKNQNGLVIAESLLKQLGFNHDLMPFRPGYLWRPYKGETWPQDANTNSAS